MPSINDFWKVTRARTFLWGRFRVDPSFSQLTWLWLKPSPRQKTCHRSNQVHHDRYFHTRHAAGHDEIERAVALDFDAFPAFKVYLTLVRHKLLTISCSSHVCVYIGRVATLNENKCVVLTYPITERYSTI